MKILYTLFLLYLTSCFLMTDTSETLGQILSEDSPDETQDFDNKDLDSAQLVKCSSRIAARNPFSINEWPKERILSTLYSLNVQAPPNLNHDQLLAFLQEVNQDQQPKPLRPKLPAAKPRKKEKIFPPTLHFQLQKRRNHLIPLKRQHNKEKTGFSQHCCQSKNPL